MSLTFTPIPTTVARACQAGGPDANGQTPERGVSVGAGTPCRHCLKIIPAGAAMLTLAHRRFPAPQPYAEFGAIFLCADPCEAGGGAEMPEIPGSSQYILRGYGPDDRIVYGSGALVPTPGIPHEAALRLADPRVAYVHVRSASYTCCLVRVDAA